MRRGGAHYSAASVILIVVALIGGASMSYLSAVATRDQYRSELVDRASTIASSLDSEKVAELEGDASDVNKPIYHELQTKLRLLKQSSTDARSIYLAGIKNGQVYFTVDSEVPGTPYYS